MIAVYCLVVVLTSVLIIRLLYHHRGLPLPPGPPAWPIIGNIKDLPGRGSQGWLHWLTHKELYGPISSVSTIGQTVIILNKADIAEELLEKRSARYSARPEAEFSNKLAGWDRTVTLKSSPKEVREHRRYMAHLLGSKRAVAKFESPQDEASRRFLLRLIDDPPRLWDHLRRYTSGLMLDVLYGYTIEPEGNDRLMSLVFLSMSQFGQAIEPGAWLVDSLPFLKYLPAWFPGAGFHRIAAEWGRVLGDVGRVPYDFVVDQIDRDTNKMSYVSEHIKERDGSPTEEEKHVIQWTAATMFAGGADTTPSALSVFFLAMALFPQVQREAQKELDQVLGTRLPNVEDRDSLPYINALVKEVIRWHPPVPLGVPHRCTQEDDYEGYRIPKDAILVTNIWGFTHDAEVYPEPANFDPKRFLELDGQLPQPDPAKLIFGFGRRICPGRFLADSSLFLVIARSLSVLSIEKVDKGGREVDPLVEFTPGMVSHPCPYQVSIKPRNEDCEALIRSFDEHVTKGDSDLLA